MLLSLSTRAIAQISNILSTEDEGRYFRVSVNGGGCSGFQYEFSIADSILEGDHQIACGDYILLLDDMSVPFVKGSELDYVTTLVSSEFQIKNPNAKASCGCGVSFSV